MPKGYVHRVYQFVSVDFQGFDPPRMWTRFVVGDVNQDLRDAPEGLDGPVHFIHQKLYDEWRLTLDGQVARAIDRVMTARNVDPVRDPVELDRLEREMRAIAGRAWATDRQMLIAARAA